MGRIRACPMPGSEGATSGVGRRLMLVLVVEDDPIVGLSLAALLEHAGHRVLGPAATLDEAVALFESERPDLAFVDVALNDGDTGPDIARALFTKWRTPIVFVTGRMGKVSRAVDVAYGFVAKPYSSDEIFRWLGGTTADAGKTSHAVTKH